MKFNIKNYDYLLVLDLEATCCDDHVFPRSEMEIIEIGAVMVDARTLEAVEEYQTFIKPRRHPLLTLFCKNLTSITQKDVDEAPYFVEAIKHFKAWVDKYPNYIFFSWGSYDKKQIEQDCLFNNVPYPLLPGHINIKTLFSEKQGYNQRWGMARAMKLADVPMAGTHHRGIDDARNMVTLLPYILGIKKIKSKN